MNTTDYDGLNAGLEALTEGTEWEMTVLSNAAALLYTTLPDLNWAGFYLVRGGVLLLGPFQGKPACTRIPMGKGVCGTAAAGHRTVRVPDVHDFPGHIACDGASRSELVIPVYRNGALYGVLDMDSPKPGRFQEADEAGLEAFVQVLERHLGDFPSE